MIAKSHRLTKNRHFQYIYRKGNSTQNRFLTLVFVKTKLGGYKVGFSISKKIGKAVVRNKVKRRMRACFNLIHPIVNNKHNYIFVAKSGIENLSFSELKSEMQGILKKANLLNE